MAKTRRIKVQTPKTVTRSPDHPGAKMSGLLDRCLAELVRFYRHSAVGRLCTGVIHNLNSPLQVISFHLELLEQKAEEEAAALSTLPQDCASALQTFHAYRQGKLQHLRQEVDRLREMMQRLALQAVHEDSQEYCYLDLNELIQDELHLYQADPFFKYQVEKVYRFNPGLPPIYGHYIDFSQSFRHLLDNALEALASSPRRVLTVVTQIQQGCRLVQIGDTGGGIPPEVIPHLFEPFFTTKSSPQRPRAGLGLFLTRLLLRPYGGEVRVESHSGETWATVSLPLSEATS